MCATLTSPPTDYVSAARRHLKDAHILMHQGRNANCGQLLGFTVECGLKALLIACGVTPDADGGIPTNNQFRKHMPLLFNAIVSNGHIIPDGQRSAHYHAMLPNVSAMSDWSIDHRYFKESALPLTSVTQWELAALEISEMLDQAIVDGVM